MRLWSLILVAGLLLAVACDPGENLVLVNDTDGAVVIELSDGRRFTLEQGEELKLTVLEGAGTDLIEVLDEADEVILSRRFSWDEMDALDFRFEIAPASK